MEISYKAVDKRKLTEVKAGELFKYLGLIYMLSFNNTTNKFVAVKLKSGQSLDVFDEMWDEFVEVVEGTLILDCYE